jgi:hypothetical protein
MHTYIYTHKFICTSLLACREQILEEKHASLVYVYTHGCPQIQNIFTDAPKNNKICIHTLTMPSYMLLIMHDADTTTMSSVTCVHPNCVN